MDFTEQTKPCIEQKKPETTPLLFADAEIDSVAPATNLTIEDLAILSGSAFVAEQQFRRRERMIDAVEAFSPLFQDPYIPEGQEVDVDSLALRIRASKGTVLRIMADLDIAAPVKKQGWFVRRLPVTVTPEFRARLLEWHRQNRKGRCVPGMLTKRVYLAENKYW